MSFVVVIFLCSCISSFCLGSLYNHGQNWPMKANKGQSDNCLPSLPEEKRLGLVKPFQSLVTLLAFTAPNGAFLNDVGQMIDRSNRRFCGMGVTRCRPRSSTNMERRPPKFAPRYHPHQRSSIFSIQLNGNFDEANGQLGSLEGATESDKIEKALLDIVQISGVFMFLWVFVLFPGSAYTGFEVHDNAIQWLFDKVPLMGIIAPISLITKYNTLGNLPAFTHAIPGAIWSILAPLQLLPGWRDWLGSKGHKAAGNVMLAAAALLMVGYFIIDANSLYADMYDFKGAGGGLAALIDDTGLLPLPFNLIGVRMIAAAFIATGGATLASAKQDDYKNHRSWAIRHVGTGLWVAAQRPLYAFVRLVQAGVMGTQASVTVGAEADAFYYCAYTTTFLYFIGAEWLARQTASVRIPSKSKTS